MGDNCTSFEPPIYPPEPLPSASHISLAPNASLQPPLSRLGIGPGLIIIDPGYGHLAQKPSAGSPDPAPQYKWAEEGYAVVRLSVQKEAYPQDWDVESGLSKAIKALVDLPECNVKDKFGLLVFGAPARYPASTSSKIRTALSSVACSGIKAVVSFSSSWEFESLHHPRPEVIHVSGGSTSPSPSSTTERKVYTYPSAASFDFIIPGTPDFAYHSASIAHSRSLAFIKHRLGGPIFDLEKIWDEHAFYEFGDRSVEKTMATMVQEPYVNHVPTMTGGTGRDNLTNFYRYHFIWNNPPDAEMELVSRTLGVDRIVDEFVFSLTHDRTIDWLLPGIPPTNKRLRIPFVAVVNIRGDRLYHEHITWDQGTVLRQLGLLPEWLPFPYQVDGMQGKLEYKVPVAGVESAMKLQDQAAVASNGLFVQKQEGVRNVSE